MLQLWKECTFHGCFTHQKSKSIVYNPSFCKAPSSSEKSEFLSRSVSPYSLLINILSFFYCIVTCTHTYTQTKQQQDLEQSRRKIKICYWKTISLLILSNVCPYSIQKPNKKVIDKDMPGDKHHTPKPYLKKPRNHFIQTLTYENMLGNATYFISLNLFFSI